MRNELMWPAGLIAVLTLTATAFLWLKYGERVFVDRLLSGLAGCF